VKPERGPFRPLPAPHRFFSVTMAERRSLPPVYQPVMNRTARAPVSETGSLVVLEKIIGGERPPSRSGRAWLRPASGGVPDFIVSREKRGGRPVASVSILFDHRTSRFSRARRGGRCCWCLFLIWCSSMVLWETGRNRRHMASGTVRRSAGDKHYAARRPLIRL